MSDKSGTPCYIARCKCGCDGLIFASVDDDRMRKERRRETAKEIAGLIRDGFVVERMSVGEVRAAKWLCQNELQF